MGGRAEESILSSPVCSGIVANTGMFRVFRWKNCRYSLQSRLRGREGGIRTLGTGVSPYNGLANSTRPLPIARNQSVTVTSGVLSRAESGCSADVYAPEYAPRPTEVLVRTEARAPRLVTWPVSDLRPHPS